MGLGRTNSCRTGRRPHIRLDAASQCKRDTKNGGSDLQKLGFSWGRNARGYLTRGEALVLEVVPLCKEMGRGRGRRGGDVFFHHEQKPIVYARVVDKFNFISIAEYFSP